MLPAFESGAHEPSVLSRPLDNRDGFLSTLLPSELRDIEPPQRQLRSPVQLREQHKRLYVLAMQGDADAQYKLGRGYYQGEAIGVDEDFRLQWLHDAGAAGNVAAQCELGDYYWTRASIEQPSSSDDVKCYQQKAIEWFRAAAQQGYSAAQIALGSCYLYGDGIEKNELAALEWLRKAALQDPGKTSQVLANHDGGSLLRQKAELGESWAQCLLGLYHRWQDAPIGDKRLAVSWLRKAAEQGFAIAQHELADCYERGVGVEPNETLAKEWSSRALENGYIATPMRGGQHENPLDAPTLAVEWLRRASAQNHAGAQRLLGQCFRDGFGVKQDEQESNRWQLKAAAGGDMDACYELGRSGKESSALEYLQRAASAGHARAKVMLTYKRKQEELRVLAERGDPKAQYQLGLCHEYGLWTTIDSVAAVRYYRLAADQGHSGAKLKLGKCIGRGEGTSQDEQQAISLVLEACRERSSEADITMALYHVHNTHEKALPFLESAAKEGQNVAARVYLNAFDDWSPEEVKKARETEWCRFEAELGNAHAQHELARRYAEGLGVARDEQAAVDWYRRAALQGHVESQYVLGVHLELSNNAKEAVEWYRKAAAQNFMPAHYRIGRCLLLGVGLEKNEKQALEHLQKAANGNDVDALFALATHLESTLDHEKNAIAYLRRAAILGHKEAQAHLKWPEDYVEENAKQDHPLRYHALLGEQRGPERASAATLVAMPVSTEESPRDDDILERQLAIRFWNGSDCERDMRFALILLRQLAVNGDAEAAFYLAECYARLSSSNRDALSTLYWYSFAANHGHVQAQLRLGDYYYRLSSEEKHKSLASKLAIEWYRVAANAGLPQAQVRLGECYELGIDGKKQDTTIAMHWHRKAIANGGDELASFSLIRCVRLVFLSSLAERNDPDALYGLACYHRHYGRVTNKNPLEIRSYVELLRKAADLDHRKAQLDLADCYAKGMFLRKDIRMAVEWLRRGAVRSYPEALFRLADLYAAGEVNGCGAREAIELYERAAHLHHRGAQQQLGICYEFGIGVEKNQERAEYWRN